MSRGAYAPTLLDEVMPRFDVNEVHDICVATTPENAYAAARAVTGEEVRALRSLMSLRAIPGALLGQPMRPSPSGGFIDQMLALGFVELAEQPASELVLGAIGRFWLPAGNQPLRDIRSRDDFLHFADPGFAKGAMNIRVTPTATGSVITTETRVLGTSPEAKRRFGLYWKVIGPWSGLIRRSLLRAVRERIGA